MWHPRILFFAVALGVLLAASFAGRAHANVTVIIDKSSQRMAVEVDGRHLYTWEVSTGRRGHGTPTGVFSPQWMARSYFSKKYYNTPMPFSIFFYRGYAIHGTHSIHQLGGPASAGCVRLHPRNAAILFDLVKQHGMRGTRIVIEEEAALRSPRPRPQARSGRFAAELFEPRRAVPSPRFRSSPFHYDEVPRQRYVPRSRVSPRDHDWREQAEQRRRVLREHYARQRAMSRQRYQPPEWIEPNERYRRRQGWEPDDRFFDTTERCRRDASAEQSR